MKSLNTAHNISLTIIFSSDRTGNVEFSSNRGRSLNRGNEVDVVPKDEEVALDDIIEPMQ